jgi:signal transduction histidine kinase
VHTAVSVNPILDRDGGYSGALAMVMDVTERKRAEEALHEIEGRLGQSPVRRETQQAASIAREFDGTVTALTGYTDYLLNRLDRGDPLFREVTQLRASAEGIVPLTRQLLAISRRESFQSGLVDLGAVLTDLELQFPRLVGDGIDVHVSADQSLGRFEADPAQIEQVLVNLLLYASHSMHDRGRIEIEAHDVDLDESFTKDHFPMRPGPYVLLAVADDGPGLDDQQRAHLFSPLFAGEHEDAAGRGLATVYGIVKQSEGFVWVDAAPGEGTTFRIYFPRVTEPLAA